MSGRKDKGITQVEVIVVVLIAVFLIAVLVPTVHRRHEDNSRTKCMNNIKQIGAALYFYAAENRGRYPRTVWDPKLADKPTQYTGVNAPNPFGPGGPAPNDVTAAMYLLIRTQDITPEVFLCPKSQAEPWEPAAASPRQFSNFPSDRHLSYSFTNPYPSTAAVNNGYKWNNSVTAEFAVTADMNPGSPELVWATINAGLKTMKRMNSLNHERQGQNVLYGDGHAEWQMNPFCGVKRDNIYTIASDETQRPDQPTPRTIGSPAWQGDSVMLPVASNYPALRIALETIVPMTLAYLLLLGAAMMLVVAMLPPPPAPAREPEGRRDSAPGRKTRPPGRRFSLRPTRGLALSIVNLLLWGALLLFQKAELMPETLSRKGAFVLAFPSGAFMPDEPDRMANSLIDGSEPFSAFLFALNCLAWGYGLAGLCWLIPNKLWPALRYPFVRQRLYRQKHGLCLCCGYDLRATPDRCPECGSIPEKSESAAPLKPPHRPSRRILWIIVAVILMPLAISLSIDAYHRIKEARKRAEYQRIFKRCADYTAPPDRVVFEMKAGVVKTLVAAEPWVEWFPSDRNHPTVFLHVPPSVTPSIASSEQLIAGQLEPGLMYTCERWTILDKPVLCVVSTGTCSSARPRTRPGSESSGKPAAGTTTIGSRPCWHEFQMLAMALRQHASGPSPLDTIPPSPYQ